MSDGDEQKSTADRILDLLVFGPAGLALTAAEEFPKLAEKGRHRVEGQIHTARLVGQFAVQMGRRQIETTVGNLFPGQRGGESTSSGPRPASSSGSGPDVPDRSPAPTPPPGVSAPAAGNGALASGALGIPGYDSLSASQVVQRLEGLSVKELEAIRQHELAHRHRRTILNRVDQLLGVPGEGD